MTRFLVTRIETWEITTEFEGDAIIATDTLEPDTSQVQVEVLPDPPPDLTIVE